MSQYASGTFSHVGLLASFGVGLTPSPAVATVGGMQPIDRNKLVSELTAEELATLIRASIPPPAERPKRLPVEISDVTFNSVLTVWLYSIPAILLIGGLMALGTCALGAIGVAGLGGVK